MRFGRPNAAMLPEAALGGGRATSYSFNGAAPKDARGRPGWGTTVGGNVFVGDIERIFFASLKRN